MKYRKILIYGQFLVDMFINGWETRAKCVRGLPEGTRFAYSIPDLYNGIWLVIQHDSFAELKDGDPIPEHTRPEMEKLNEKL